jgi:Peptidase family M28
MKLLCLFIAGAYLMSAQEKALQPRVREVIEAVSEERIAVTIRKLAGFPTRNTLSTEGIAAARQWILQEFQSYSPRLQVTLEHFKVKKNEERIFRDVDLYNVVAVLPGTSMPETQILVAGHYDSLNLVPKPGAANPPETSDNAAERTASYDWTQVDVPSPGANDDGSGTAAVMELARVLSRYEFPKTLVFIAFAGEEQGLIGSTLHAAQARKQDQVIEAVLNNDIIGGETSGNGRTGNSSVNVFGSDFTDSNSQQLARYVRQTEERYLPSMRVNMIYMQDRLGRGGDHSPFQQEGYAAVRFSTPNEDYAHQHSATDLVEFVSAPYTARVARINAAVAASLALAPKPPVVTRVATTGALKGQLVPRISRGKSRYDAQLQWKSGGPDSNLKGYSVVMRSTTAPNWEQEIFVGNRNEYVLKDVSIDEFRFGVKAIDSDGNESLVAPYVYPPRQKREIPVY